MAGIVYKQNGKYTSLTGPAYTQPHAGTARFCVKTSTSTIKFGLTTNTSATQYCGIRMKLNGNVAYIGRTESTKSTVKTSSSTSTSVNTSSASSSSISGNYSTYSTSEWTSKRESWYDYEVPKNSSGTRVSYYTATLNDAKVTTGYQRWVSVTVSNYSHTLRTYSKITTNQTGSIKSTSSWAAQTTSSATGKVLSSQFTARSTSMSQSSNSVLSYIGSIGYVKTISSFFTYYTRSKANSTKLVHSYRTYRSYQYQTLTTSTGYGSTGNVFSTINPQYYYITAKTNVIGITKNYAVSLSEAYQSRAAANGAYATAGGWFVAQTEVRDGASVSRDRHTYTAITGALTATATRIAQQTRSSGTTSYWTETARASRWSEYQASSKSTWMTTSSSSVSGWVTYTVSQGITNHNHTYTKSVSTHNYNI